MAKLYNLARMTTATTGTGTITLGSAVSSYVTFANAGVQNGETVTYAIVDGTNREVGRGVYTSSGTTLTRATILESTNANAAINLSGNAEVFITAAAEDIANVGETNTFTSSQVISVTDNSNAALRITQEGTGNAFVVEDSANPDSTPFVIDASGNVTTSSRVSLTGSSQTNTGAASILNMSQTWNAPTIAVTSVSGNGTSVTLTHAAQASAVPVGSTINVSGFTPSGYNTATGAVTASTTTTTTYTNSNTAAVTVLGQFQVNIVTPILLNITNTSSSGTPSLLDLRVNGTSQFFVSRAGAIQSASGMLIQNTAAYAWSGRGFLTSPAAGGVQLGNTDAAAPVAQTLSAQSVVAGTSNTSGVDLTIRGSRGTGTGAGGSIIFQTAAAGSSGTAQNAAAERFRIDASGALGIGGANYGTSGQVLTSQGASSAPIWSAPGGMTLLTDLAASGTNPIASGLTLTDYKQLFISIEGVTQNSGSNRQFLIGTSTADDLVFTGSAFSSVACRGMIWIDLNAGTLATINNESAASTLQQIPNNSGVYYGDTTITTASTAVSFALSSTGSFSGGTFRIYGVK